MKTAMAVGCALLLIAGSAGADVDSLWCRTYGGPYNDGFRSAIATGDGGYLAVGYTYSFGPDNVNVYAVKTDAAGDTIWTRTYGGSGEDYAYDVRETGDGGFVIAGYTSSFGAGVEDAYILKVDSGGDTLWTRTYGGAKLDEARGVCVTSDGYIVVTGMTDSFADDIHDMFVLKLEDDGDTVWTRVIDDADYNWGQSVCELGDGNYAICGSRADQTSNLQMWVLKMDPGGSVIWDYEYGDAGLNNPDYGMCVRAVADTEMVVCGKWAIEVRDPLGPSFLRADLDGAPLGYRRYTRGFSDIYYDCGNSICFTDDQGYLFCGAIKDNTTHNNDLMLLKRVWGSGWVWEQHFGGSGSDWGNSIWKYAPGHYIVSGHTSSFGAGGYDAWLINVRDEQAGAPAAGGKEGSGLLAGPAPNPVVSGTVIRFQVPGNMDVNLSIYDVTGRLVRALESGHRVSGEYATAWDGRDSEGVRVSPGVYVVKLAAGRASESRKVVVLE
ncbi:MAG: FlgD immunoglobulin-like domain containing protein [bacterium]